MHPPSLLELSSARKQDDQDSTMTLPALPSHFAPGHSRNSSGASSASPPITPTFSTRGHSRFPSSSSSLATSPDSPTNIAKPTLHDLVEDPAERDESAYMTERAPSIIEPLCICDTPFCEHRRVNASFSPALSPSNPEWIPGDDSANYGRPPTLRSIKRQRSMEMPKETLSSRMSRRWPSISSRWRDMKPTTSVSSSSVRSAPPSRSSSGRQSSLKSSLAGYLEPRKSSLPPPTQRETMSSRGHATSHPNSMDAVDIAFLSSDKDPIDRQELSSTPLLPPLMTEMKGRSDEALQSPLQSPSVATYSTTGSVTDTPISSPVYALSARPSYASFSQVRFGHATYPTSDSPPSIFDHAEYWATRLGHSDFKITPEPYMPETCDRESCNRLVNDWEAARIDYMRHAAHISEHYGPTSRTYKLTEEKWSEIDSQWRSNLEWANAEAEATGELPALQCLAETQPPPKMNMTSLVDPQQPDKFPAIDSIVGPMVQYEKIQRTPSRRKNNFLRLFTDPATLLGRRSTFGTRS